MGAIEVFNRTHLFFRQNEIVAEQASIDRRGARQPAKGSLLEGHRNLGNVSNDRGRFDAGGQCGLSFELPVDDEPDVRRLEVELTRKEWHQKVEGDRRLLCAGIPGRPDDRDDKVDRERALRAAQQKRE